MALRIAVHGHFYQPPRDDPWTGAIDEQPSAAPFHDWNERVHAEAYRPNAFASIPTESGERVVNNFERLSFNVGPTLLAWIERADREVYDRIVDADAASAARLGHGNAIAQAFHHSILPLSPLRDARTEVRWGLADFRHRFGRDAAGMWLPETAANDDTLEVLIDEGVRFTVLSPAQASRWRHPGEGWTEVTADEPIDPRVGYRYHHRDGSGRFLSLLFYDGDIAQAIAFEGAGSSAEGFLDLFASHPAEDHHLVHAATDGETYGHHHEFTELGLAFALFVEAERRGVEVTNYASYLEAFPAEREVAIAGGEGSSWSCAHGVGRWIRHCGCSTGGEPGWNQRWRTPLRRALEVLRGAADEAFERLGARVFADPWRARDRYADVVIGARDLGDLLAEEASGPAVGGDAAAGDLLELQRHALAMFTSCAWFFADCAGIETTQVLRYAARVIDLLDVLGQPAPTESFLALLGQAKSNDTAAGTAADVFRSVVPA